MTSKGSALVSTAVILVTAGTVLRMSSLVLMAVPIVVYIILAQMVEGEPQLLVSVSRSEGAGKIFEGGVMELRTGLVNNGDTLGLLRVEDVLPRGLRIASGNNVGFASLAKGEQVQMRYELTSNAPGSYTVGPIVLQATDSFGLRSKLSVIGDTLQLDVLPGVEPHRGIPFRPKKTENWPGQVVSPRAGPGQEFYAVRQYLSTDPARMVNWKAWARLDKMYSNQYMSELGSDAVIIVDKSSASDFGVPPESALTYVERCSAAVSRGLLFSGNRVGMVIIGDRVYRVNLGTGRRQLEKILLTLVRSKKGQAEAMGLLPEYLSLWFPRTANVVAVSSLTNPKVLPPLVALGVRRDLQVVSPSFGGATIGGRRSGELEEVAGMLVGLQRKTTVEHLRRYAGVVDWKVDARIEIVLEQAQLRRNRLVAR